MVVNYYNNNSRRRNYYGTGRKMNQSANMAYDDSDQKETNVLFGDLLVNRGLITHEQLMEALEDQKKRGGRLGEVICRLGLINDKDMVNVLAEHFCTESVHFDDLSKIDIKLARQLPENISKRFNMAAVWEDSEGKVLLAMSDPLNVIAIDTATLKLKRQVQVAICSEGEMQKAIEFIYHGSDIEEQQIKELVEVQINESDDRKVEDILSNESAQEQEAAKAPVVQYVNLLLSQAVKSRASDIHIEPQEGSMKIRMRIDGMLREMIPPAKSMQAAIITRVKLLSDMDIAERRLPQDGRLKVKIQGREIDVRVSTIPAIYGEKIVMRILDTQAVDHNIEKIGFEPRMLREFKHVLAQPYGIIVVTGPTGSGKSTTLYSVLNYLKNPSKNITTVEDPVEYRLEGINQIQVKPDIDLNFARCLRSILRQDPDIILIGEIRDRETMEIAMKASMTGHLVLSTFHTNDAPSAISRFLYMGLEPYLLSSSLNLVVAQRLVRKICRHCKEELKVDEEVYRQLKIEADEQDKVTIYHGAGCKNCNGTGYSGRVPIFEFLVMDREIRQLVVDKVSELEIRQAARNKGYGGLLESGVDNILKGLTTPEEVLRVTFAEDIQ